MNSKDPWAVRGWTTGHQQVVIRSCTDDPKMSTVHPQAVGELSTGCPRAGDASGDAKGRSKVSIRPTGRPKIVFAERLPSFKPRGSRSGSGPAESGSGPSGVAHAPTDGPAKAAGRPSAVRQMALGPSILALEPTISEIWTVSAGCPQ